MFIATALLALAIGAALVVKAQRMQRRAGGISHITSMAVTAVAGFFLVAAGLIAIIARIIWSAT